MVRLTLSPGLFSRKTPEWVTPQPLFDALNQEFRFTLDAAADPRNAKVARFYTKADNGLLQPWTGRVYCNPPWSDGEVALWLAKGLEAVMSGEAEVVVFLLPARTDPEWWHTYVMQAQEVRLIKGRLKFLPTDGVCTIKPSPNPKKPRPCVGPCKGHGAPFPCAVAVVVFSAFAKVGGATDE